MVVLQSQYIFSLLLVEVVLVLVLLKQLGVVVVEEVLVVFVPVGQEVLVVEEVLNLKQH